MKSLFYLAILGLGYFSGTALAQSPSLDSAAREEIVFELSVPTDLFRYLPEKREQPIYVDVLAQYPERELTYITKQVILRGIEPSEGRYSRTKVRVEGSEEQIERIRSAMTAKAQLLISGSRNSNRR